MAILVDTGYETNVLLNGSAENDTNEWLDRNNVTAVSGGVIGAKCFKMNVNGNMRQEFFFQIQPNDIKVSGYFYSNLDFDKSPNAYVECVSFYNDSTKETSTIPCNNIFLSTVNGTVEGSSVQWQKFEAIIPIKENTVLTKFQIRIFTTSESGLSYFDELKVLPNGFNNFLEQLRKSKEIVDAVTDGIDKLRTSAFEAFARDVINDINSSKSEVKYDSRGIVLQSTSNANRMVVASSEGIVVSVDGLQTIEAAVTADGVIADKIVGVLGQFAQVRASSIVVGIDGGKIPDNVIAGANSWNNTTQIAQDASAAAATANSIATTAKNEAESAITVANTAQVSADAANALLSDLSNDNKLTPSEKQEVRKEWDIIVSEKPLVNAQAISYNLSIDNNNFNVSFQALADYLNSGATWSSGTPAMLVDLTVSSNIDGPLFRQKFKDYYDKKMIIMKKSAESAKSIADTAQASAEQAASEAEIAANNAASALTAAQNAQTVASNAQDAAEDAAEAAQDAQTTANSAQSDASAANALLSDLSNDNKLTPSEKQEALKEWNKIIAEKPTINAQATAYSITTENNNYNSSFNSLAQYLNNGTVWSSGTPVILQDLTVASNINGTTFRNSFKDYYDKRQLLLKAISDKAKVLADAAQLAANNAQTAADNAKQQADLANAAAQNAIAAANNAQQTADAAQTAANAAQQTAIAAQANANAANSQLGDLSDDNKLSPIEKQDVKQTWDTIVTEKPIITSQADSYGITSFNILNANQTDVELNLNGLTAYSPTSGTYSFVRDTSVFNTGTASARITNTGSSSETKGIYADVPGIVEGRSYSLTIRSRISTTGQVAYLEIIWINTSNNIISTVKSNDLSLTASTWQSLSHSSSAPATAIKARVGIYYKNLPASQSGWWDTADFRYIDEKTEYNNAFQALANYLNNGTTWISGTPALLADLGSASDINGPTFRSRFSTYYVKRQALLTAITIKAKALADAAQAAAEAAQAAAEAALQPGAQYNGVVIDYTNGLTITRTDNKVKTIANATTGIKIQKNTGTPTTPVWQDQFYADSNGDLILRGTIYASAGSFTGNINATSGTFSGTIVGGEFIGPTFTTAVTGRRIQMELNNSGTYGSGGGITCYNEANQVDGFFAYTNGYGGQAAFGFARDGVTVLTMTGGSYVGDLTSASITFPGGGQIGTNSRPIVGIGNWQWLSTIQVPSITTPGSTLSILRPVSVSGGISASSTINAPSFGNNGSSVTASGTWNFSTITASSWGSSGTNSTNGTWYFNTIYPSYIGSGTVYANGSWRFSSNVTFSGGFSFSGTLNLGSGSYTTNINGSSIDLSSYNVTIGNSSSSGSTNIYGGNIYLNGNVSFSRPISTSQITSGTFYGSGTTYLTSPSPYTLYITGSSIRMDPRGSRVYIGSGGLDVQSYFNLDTSTGTRTIWSSYTTAGGTYHQHSITFNTFIMYINGSYRAVPYFT